MNLDEYEWWKKCVIYQVYPRSFQDSDGDGTGDIPGILDRLDYLEWLGVDAMWLSPVYPSPMADFGYDVSDYTAIDPMFGTIDDFDQLREELHRRDMKLLIDFVPNHSSDQHEWFQASRSSRESPKRDWYIWADPNEDGGPPNNWLSVFGGSAWELDESTGQYYYHAFLAEQPDLNWRNPEVRETMYDVLRWWLDRGVDGFRVDVIWHMIHDKRLRNNPRNPDYDPELDTPYESYLPVFTTDQPEVHEIVREMRTIIDQYDERLLIGEVYLPIDRLVTYYGEGGGGGDEAHLPFNFSLIGCQWDAGHIEAVVDEYEASLPEGAWPNWVVGNHDQPRVASRVGLEQARVAAMLLLTLRGTPTMYYGDEIGMENVEIPAERVQDPQALNQEDQWGRDPVRTPMQWDDSHAAGFTTADEPWLPLSDDWQTCNVNRLKHDGSSILVLYRELLRLRGRVDALHIGDYEPWVEVPDDVYAFIRSDDDEAYLVLLNFGDGSYTLPLRRSGVIVLDTSLQRRGEECTESIDLGPNEGLIMRKTEL